MALAPHSIPDSLSPTSPGYRGFQSYNWELTAELGARFGGICGPNGLC